MERRVYLRSVAGIAAVAGIAGCSGDGGDGTDTATDTATPTETATPTPNPARDHYDEAIGDLVENQETLDEWATGESSRDEQTLADLQDRLESARDSLDEAEQTAPDDLTDRITQARNVAAFQAAILLFYEDVFEFESTRADAETFEESEQHERAADTYEEATDVIDQIRNRVDEMETAHEVIENDVLEASTLDYSDDFLAYTELGSRSELEPFESLMSAKASFNRGLVDLNEGFNRWDEEEYATAREEWTSARDNFQASRSSFEAVQNHDAAPQGIRQEGIFGMGVAEDFEEGTELFVDATREAQAGNIDEAISLIEEGQDIHESALE